MLLGTTTAPSSLFRRLRIHDVQHARCSCSDPKISWRTTRMALDAVGRCLLATRACLLTVLPKCRGLRHRPPRINSCLKPFLGAITPQVATRIAIRRGILLGTSTHQTSTRILACGSSDIRYNIWSQVLMVYYIWHSWVMGDMAVIMADQMTLRLQWTYATLTSMDGMTNPGLGKAGIALLLHGLDNVTWITH